MALLKSVNFNNLREGTVTLLLQDINGTMPAKWYTLNSQQKKIPVPMNYALSIFVDSVLQRMLEEQYFEIVEVDAFRKAAEEYGLVGEPDQDPVILSVAQPKKSPETILAILKGGNMQKITELFKSPEGERALEIAKTNIKAIPSGVITELEELFGVALIEG